MFLMWIVPLLLIGLVIHTTGNTITNAFKPAARRACPYCNQPAQNDWKTLPTAGRRWVRRKKHEAHRSAALC